MNSTFNRHLSLVSSKNDKENTRLLKLQHTLKQNETSKTFAKKAFQKGQRLLSEGIKNQTKESLFAAEKELMKAKLLNSELKLEVDLLLFDLNYHLGVSAASIHIMDKLLYENKIELTDERKAMFSSIIEKLDDETKAAAQALREINLNDYNGYWGYLLNAAIEFEENGNLKKAFAYYKKVEKLINSYYPQKYIKTNPHLSAPLFYQGQNIFFKGMANVKHRKRLFAQSYKKLTAAKDMGFVHTTLFEHLGIIYGFWKKYKKSFENLSKAYDLDNRNADACIHLSYHYMERGDFTQAKLFLERAEKVAPKYELLIVAKSDLENILRSQKLEVKTTKLSPIVSEIEKKLSLNNPKEFLTALKLSCKDSKLNMPHSPKDYNDLLEMGRKYINSGIKRESQEDFSKAEKALLIAMSINDSIEANKALAELYYHRKFYDISKYLLNRIPEDVEDSEFNAELSPKENMLVDKIEQIAGRPHVYIEFAEKVLENNPGHWAAHSNLASAYRIYAVQMPLNKDKRNKYASKSIEHYKKAVELLLNSSINQSHAANSLEAIQNSYSSLYSSFPAIGLSYFGIGELLFYQALDSNDNLAQKRLYKQSEEYLERSRSLGCFTNMSLQYLGIIKESKNQLAEAHDLLSQAFEFDNDDIDTLTHLCNVCLKLKQPKQAKGYLDKLENIILSFAKEIGIEEAEDDLLTIISDLKNKYLATIGGLK